MSWDAQEVLSYQKKYLTIHRLDLGKNIINISISEIV